MPLDQQLLNAIERRDKADVQSSLAAGADPKKNHGEALSKAIVVGDIEIVRLLLKAGVTAKVTGAFDLVQAAKYNRVDIINILLDHGRDANAHNGEALFNAVAEGNLEATELLLEVCDKSSLAYPGLLSASVFQRHPKIVSLLLSADCVFDLTLFDDCVNTQSGDCFEVVVGHLLQNESTGWEETALHAGLCLGAGSTIFRILGSVGNPSRQALVGRVMNRITLRVWIQYCERIGPAISELLQRDPAFNAIAISWLSGVVATLFEYRWSEVQSSKVVTAWRKMERLGENLNMLMPTPPERLTTVLI